MATLLTFGLFLALCVLCLVRPYVILAVVLCSYSFEQVVLTHSSFFRGHPAAINLGCGLLALIALLGSILQGKNPLSKLSPVTLFFVLLLGWAAVSVIWSIEPQLTSVVLKLQMPYIATFVLIVPLCYNNFDDVRRGLGWMLLFGTITALLLLLTTHVHDWGRTIALTESILNRAGKRENRMNPLAVASMAGSLMLVAGLMRVNRLGRLYDIGRWVIALLALVLIVRSESRGQLFGGLTLLALLTGFARSKTVASQFLVTMITTTLVVIMLLGAFAVTTVTSTQRFEMGEMSNAFVGSRVYMCAQLMIAWVNAGPIAWLVGLGSSASYDPRVVGFYPHVVPVEILGELGLIGLAIYGTLVFFAVYQGLGLYRLVVRHGDMQQRSAIVALLGLAMFEFLLTLKQGSFLGNPFFFMLVCIVGRCHYAAVAEFADVQKRDLVRKWLLARLWVRRLATGS